MQAFEHVGTSVHEQAPTIDDEEEDAAVPEPSAAHLDPRDDAHDRPVCADVLDQLVRSH